MSLMNQVLRDLQRRRISQPETALQMQIKPVVRPGWRLSRGGLSLALGLACLFALGVFVFLPQEKPHEAATTRVPPAVVESPPAVKALLPGVHLAAVRLVGAGETTRLLLEFSQPPELAPEVIMADRQMTVLLPELLTANRELPQPGMSNDLVAGLSLLQVDHLWRLQVNFKSDVRVEKLSIGADLLHGERLAFDIFPTRTLAPKAEPTPVAAVAPPPAVAEAVRGRAPLAKVVTKQHRKPTLAERVDDFYQRGVEAAQAARLPDAMHYWQKVLTLQPGHLRARKQLIRALVRTDRRQADKLFAEGLGLNPPLTLRKWYARTLLPVFGPAAAGAVLLGERVSVAEDAEYRALQAGLWQQAGDYPAAQRAYAELLQRFPAHELYRFGLAISLDQQAQGTAALAQYREALKGELDPGLRHYARQRVLALAAQNGEKS